MSRISEYTQNEIDKINTDRNANRTVKYFFTSEDIVNMKGYINEDNNPSITGLVQYFNAKIEYNRIADILEQIILNGVNILPKVAFKPITEACAVVDGKFTLTNAPYEMDGFFFLNNLVVMKNEDGSFDFYMDVVVDAESKVCTINTDKDGIVTVSYFIMNTGATSIFTPS